MELVIPKNYVNVHLSWYADSVNSFNSVVSFITFWKSSCESAVADCRKNSNIFISPQALTNLKPLALDGGKEVHAA